jgi:hypothetical protein
MWLPKPFLRDRVLEGKGGGSSFPLLGKASLGSALHAQMLGSPGKTQVHLQLARVLWEHMGSGVSSRL